MRMRIVRAAVLLSMALAPMLAAQPGTGADAAGSDATVPPPVTPRVQRLGEGTLPILPCAADTDTDADTDAGCVELLYDGAQPPVACWSLPPFGPAGVAIDAAPPQPPLAGTATHRLLVRFVPLSAVPAAVPATLHFGFPRAGQPLVCDQQLVVVRPASALALPALDLGVIGVDLTGRVSGAGLVQPVFPAAGQPPVGPITVSSRIDLHAADRQGSPIPVALALPEGATVTAARFAELVLSPRPAEWFPALGPLTGTALLTAPQLAQPLEIKLTATSRIGWRSILAMLVLGIGAGALVHRVILPRQALARARLAAGEAILAASTLRDRETDAPLLARLTALMEAQKAAVAAARTDAAVTAATEAMTTAVAAELKDAEAERQDLAARIAPLRAALAVLPEGSELPMEPLASWLAVLDQAQALIDAREITRPRALLDGEAAQAQQAAMAALATFAPGAVAALGQLDRWTRDAAVRAFQGLASTAPGFALPDDIAPAEALARLRTAWLGLRRAAITSQPAIAEVLRAQAEGAANAGLPEAIPRSEAILETLPQHPLAALADLARLVEDYAKAARARNLPGFEALADVHAAVESARIPPPLRRPPAPEAPPLALLTAPRIATAGREVTIHLVGLPADRGARIWTAYGGGRLAAGDTAGLAIRPAYPGPLAVEVTVLDARGRTVSRHDLVLFVQPAPEAALPALNAELRRSDRLAVAAAGVLALLSGAALFSVVPLTNWWGLLAPLLWGFFVNLNLPEVIQGLQARRDAVLKANGVGQPAP